MRRSITTTTTTITTSINSISSSINTRSLQPTGLVPCSSRGEAEAHDTLIPPVARTFELTGVWKASVQ
ncbi:hypothetical protein INR49_013641 [Caranx melampygus]|nr:hypothetical protein INR49_013641 [Caranx melampygus]